MLVFSVILPHTNLVIALESVEAYDPYFTGASSQNSGSVVAPRNCELEWFCDCIKAAVRHAHTPNKVLDICYIFLMVFLREHNHATLSFFIWFYPCITKQLICLLHNKFSLIWTVWRFVITNWFSATCVNPELISENWTFRPSFNKTIPVVFDDWCESNSSGCINWVIKC